MYLGTWWGHFHRRPHEGGSTSVDMTQSHSQYLWTPWPMWISLSYDYYYSPNSTCTNNWVKDCCFDWGPVSCQRRHESAVWISVTAGRCEINGCCDQLVFVRTEPPICDPRCQIRIEHAFSLIAPPALCFQSTRNMCRRQSWVSHSRWDLLGLFSWSTYLLLKTSSLTGIQHCDKHKSST